MQQLFTLKKKTLVSVYKGRVDIDLALEHLADIVEFYKTTKIYGSVVDLKGLYGSFAKVFEYMANTYYPIAIENGLKSQVYVVSEDLIVNNLGSKLKTMATSFKLKSEVFSEREEAEKWLKENINKC